MNFGSKREHHGQVSPGQIGLKKKRRRVHLHNSLFYLNMNMTIKWAVILGWLSYISGSVKLMTANFIMFLFLLINFII